MIRASTTSTPPSVNVLPISTPLLHHYAGGVLLLLCFAAS